MKTNRITRKPIGEIGVDAGLCWIGDPCYILHTDQPPKAIGKTGTNSATFCTKITCIPPASSLPTTWATPA
jgi:hypothetical protein